MGIPASLITFMMSIDQMIINGLMSGYGDLTVAGYGVSIKVHMIISNLLVGLGQGVHPLLGYCYGGGLKKRYQKIFRFSLLYATVISTALTVLSVLLSRQLVGLFLSDPTAYAYGVRFSVIALSSGPLFGILYVTINALQAIGRAAEPLVISVFRQGILLVPLIFLMRAWAGMTGLVWAQPISDVISTALAVLLYRRAMKKVS